MTTKTLTLAECKNIVSQLIDASPDSRDMRELRGELLAVDDFENLACVLEEVMIHADSGSDAYRQAEELRQMM